MIRLLDEEPDLATGIPERDLVNASRHTITPVITAPRGGWSPADLREDRGVNGPFAALVLSGLMARDLVLADRVATQLVGAGDVIPLGGWDDGSPPAHEAWRVGTPADLAILDQRFLAASQRWPWLTARLVERAARWADRAATLQAIAQLGRVDLRLVALLWHLADRWGRVSSEGIVVPLRLTHETLGRLVGAQRPTVTLALRDLREQGVLRRRGAGWLLSSESRALLDPAQPLLDVEREAAPQLAEHEPVGSPGPVGDLRDLAERLRAAREATAASRAHAASIREQTHAQSEDAVLMRAEAILSRREWMRRRLPPED